MWRVGHQYAELDSSKKIKKLPSVIKDTVVKKKETDFFKKTSSQKLPKFSAKMIDPRNRRGSILAAEHLLRRRSSRAGKHLSSGIPLDHFSPGQTSRRPSVAVKLGRIKEIQERINKVMTDYDTRGDEEDETDDDLLINDVEDGLVHIQDDMMRINVSSLISKFKNLQRYCAESKSMPAEPEESSKNEALQSLQEWIEQDRFDDTDGDEPEPPELILPDKEVISAELSQISSKVQNLVKLKQRIKSLKNRGNDTHFLERQRENLQLQMRTEVERLQERKASSAREFSYIKNASAEIYDLLQRTKIEGMAQSHQFEEQLRIILKEMDMKKAELDAMQNLANNQKKINDKWAKDYEKLNNELIITSDERNDARELNRKLKQEMSQLKQKLNALEKSMKTGEILTKVEHEDAVAEIEKALISAKQGIVVLKKTLEEKNDKINELNQQASRLKASLRKNSSVSLNSEISFHHSVSELGSRSHNQRNCMSRDSSKTLFSSTDSFLLPNSDKIISSLREEIESLRDQLYKALNRKRDYGEEEDDKQSGERIIRPRKYPRKLLSQETQTVDMSALKQTAVAAAKVPPFPTVVTANASCQTTPQALLPHLSTAVREDLTQTCQSLFEKFGPDWIEIALKLTALEKDDVTEINKAMLLENDLLRIYSGSPTEEEKDKEEEYTEESKEQQIESVIEQMLQGEIPDLAELKKLDSVRVLDSHLEHMTTNVAKYVRNVKRAVNNQAGMMSEVNAHVKQAIPKEEIANLELEKSKLADSSCAEHSKEWHEMDSLEQANCKMSYIEETIRNLIKETNNIYETEIDKQHATFKNLCMIAKKNDKTFGINDQALRDKLKNIKVKAQSRGLKESFNKDGHSIRPMILSSYQPLSDKISYPSKSGTFVDSDEKLGKVISGRLWHYASKPPNEPSGHFRKDHHKVEFLQTKPDIFKTQYGVEAKVARSSDVTKLQQTLGIGKSTRVKSKGMGLVIAPAVHKEGDYMPQRTEKNVPLYFKDASSYRGRLSIAPRQHDTLRQFAPHDIHRHLYDPQLQKLAKTARPGINMKSTQISGLRKRFGQRKYFLEPKSPFLLRS